MFFVRKPPLRLSVSLNFHRNSTVIGEGMFSCLSLNTVDTETKLCLTCSEILSHASSIW